MKICTCFPKLSSSFKFYMPIDQSNVVGKYPSYLLRWFTPELEMDLCGHATLATAHVLLTEYEHDKEGIRYKF